MYFSPSIKPKTSAQSGNEYDTAAIRREARKIQSCFNHIDGSAMPRIQGARAKLDGNFEGRTADALDESLTEAQNRVRTLSDELKCLYQALMRYADALEEADRRAAQLLSR